MRVLHLTAKSSLSDRQRHEAMHAVTGNSFMGLDEKTAIEIATGRHDSLCFVEAAQVDCEDKALAFEWTNSIEAPWFICKREHVTPSGKSRRSTSVNDLMLHDHKVFIVRPVGFHRLDLTPDAVNA